MKAFRIKAILFLFLGFISCNKEKIGIIENVDIPLLTKEIYSDELAFEYTYNSENLLKEQKSKFSYTSYSYNSDNQLISYDFYEDLRIYSSTWQIAEEAMKRKDWVSPQNTDISGRGIYSYTRGKLLKIEVQRFLTDYSNSSSYEQDEYGRISKQTFLYENKPSGYIEYKYDNSGNPILKNQYS